MNMLKSLVNMFKRSEKGQGLVEYGLILALISLVSIGSVTNMSSMFSGSKVTNLDLSRFDTGSVTNMSSMFRGLNISTGYARTQGDADKFNGSSNKPSGLTFTVK